MDSASLHVVYRSFGGENVKGRPAYYSKALALQSFVRAVRALDTPPEVIFLNDGPIAQELLDWMLPVGEIVSIRCGSNLRSYRAAVKLTVSRGWADDALVWFAEDDYLYAPHALRTLVEGAAAMPDGDYFSLYSPADVGAATGGTGWVRAVSTTSTFGVRLGLLREDRRLLLACPFSGGAWDHSSCLAVQGRQPFAWRELRAELLRPEPRSSLRAMIRIGINLRSRRRPQRRRTLYAADPLPILHMETTPGLGIETDGAWTTLAAQTEVWAAGRSCDRGECQRRNSCVYSAEDFGSCTGEKSELAM